MRVFDLKVSKSVATASRQEGIMSINCVVAKSKNLIEDEKETRKEQQLKINFYPLYQKLMMTKKLYIYTMQTRQLLKESAAVSSSAVLTAASRRCSYAIPSLQ
ncbi:unnamed protein product [Amoebophrya sp. A120]|nr:unnamed protein product [Amoebophrya sp. A120]|eukprot:GSA120T00025173001.1